MKKSLIVTLVGFALTLGGILSGDWVASVIGKQAPAGTGLSWLLCVLASLPIILGVILFVTGLANLFADKLASKRCIMNILLGILVVGIGAFCLWLKSRGGLSPALSDVTAMGLVVSPMGIILVIIAEWSRRKELKNKES